MQRRGPICSCTAGSLQARLIPRWFRPYSVHRVPRWKGVPLSEYIPIKKSELRYTRLCPRALYTLHPAPCTFYPLVQLFSFPFSNLLSFPAYPSHEIHLYLPRSQPRHTRLLLLLLFAFHQRSRDPFSLLLCSQPSWLPSLSSTLPLSTSFSTAITPSLFS